MHRRDISRAKDTSSGNESAVHRKDEYRRRAEQMNKSKIGPNDQSKMQGKKTSEVAQESTSSSKDRISYRNGILELAKQRQQAYYQKDRSLTSSANQRDWHILQGCNAKYKLLASHSTARELGVPKGGGLCCRLSLLESDDDEITNQFEKTKNTDSPKVTLEQQEQREADAVYNSRLRAREWENSQDDRINKGLTELGPQ